MGYFIVAIVSFAAGLAGGMLRGNRILAEERALVAAAKEMEQKVAAKLRKK